MTTPEFLAEPAELASWLGTAENDPKTLNALRAATRRFRGAVGHDVTLATDTVVLDGNGREALLLPVWPATEVASVDLDGEALVDGTDYAWSEAGILRRLCRRCWPDSLRCLTVTYSHGWETVPGEIQEAVIDQARSMFYVRPGVQSMTTGAQSVSYGAQASVGVTDQWSQAVARHKVRTSGDI
ncbi:mobile element protein [Streptomyces xanthochromogenes]|uniref:mobile element protein n=1 Tax=Streptomyces xanthochromogenes TaxID=67384 RepID=UPI002F4094E0